jgi:hypothetical protein
VRKSDSQCKYLDFGAGYNPIPGYLTCDITTNPKLDYQFCEHNNKIIQKNGKICPQNYFNVIKCRNVFHHIENIIPILLELKRIIRYDGYIEIVEPNSKYFIHNVFLDYFWYRWFRRSNLWFAHEYRNYMPILKKFFRSVEKWHFQYDEIFVLYK